MISMKTVTLLTFGLVVLASATNAQFDTYKTDPAHTWKALNLQGKVKFIEFTNYNLWSGWSKRDPKDTALSFGTAYAFNEKGSCTLFIRYDYDEDQKIEDTRIETTYDVHENRTVQHYYDDGKVYFHEYIDYTYDGNGRILEAILVRTDETNNVISKRQRNYTHNADGTVQLKDINLMDPDTEPRIETFDASGNFSDFSFVRRGHYDYWGRLVMVMKNEHGLVTEEEYIKNDTTWNKILFTYNDALQLTEKKEIHFNPELTYTYTYSYDERGNEISETAWDYKGNFHTAYLSSYDQYNNLVKVAHMKTKKKVDFETYSKYSYDDQGNWILKEETASTDNLVPGFTTRVITYFS
jgi:hypothetical protein